MPSTESTVLTVWSDIGCPWASLALHTLRREFGDGISIRHRVFPLELFNERPTPREIVDPEIAAIAEKIPDTGWCPWPGADSEYPSTTLLAMEAVQAVQAMQGPQAADELDKALRAAFYVRGECIATPAVVLAAARRCSTVDTGRLADALESGEYRRLLYLDWRSAGREGVRGSPHLFTPDGRSVHNPGVRFHWADTGNGRRPVIDEYDAGWARRLIGDLARKGDA